MCGLYVLMHEMENGRLTSSWRSSEDAFAEEVAATLASKAAGYAAPPGSSEGAEPPPALAAAARSCTSGCPAALPATMSVIVGARS